MRALRRWFAYRLDAVADWVDPDPPRPSITATFTRYP